MGVGSRCSLAVGTVDKCVIVTIRRVGLPLNISLVILQREKFSSRVIHNA